MLLEDFPGLGKTLAARSFAQTLGLDFTRAQFTPDLLPADLTGSFIYDQRIGEFAFRRGPLFTGLLLADEINRTPPKTQAALLEAMQERQVTVEGQTFPLAVAVPRPRHRQPDRVRGHLSAARGAARPLPAAGQLRLPDADEEWDVLRRRLARQREEQSCAPSPTPPALLAMQAAIETRRRSTRASSRYCVSARRPRRAASRTCWSARRRAASLALLLTARAAAVIAGRDYVTPEDVKAVAVPVLAHRITIKPELWMSKAIGLHGRRGSDLVDIRCRSAAEAVDHRGAREDRTVMTSEHPCDRRRFPGGPRSPTPGPVCRCRSAGCRRGGAGGDRTCSSSAAPLAVVALLVDRAPADGPAGRHRPPEHATRSRGRGDDVARPGRSG